MGGDGAVGGGDKFGDVFVAINGIELRRGVRLVENKRACRDWFGWIPDNAVGDKGAVWLPTVAGDADIVVVCETVKVVGRAVGGNFKILPAATLVVERH